MNKYHFVAEIEGISLGARFDMGAISPLVRNVSIQQGAAGEVKIDVAKSRTWPADIALGEAWLEVDELLDRLAVIDNHRVVAVRYSGFTDENGQLNGPPRKDGMSASATAGIPDPASYYCLPRQKAMLEGRLNPGLTRLHRTAQGMPNGIGKFLLLYAALQVTHGEKQALVDKHLLNVRPDTLVVQGKHRRETIVTHLRNLIAHPENDIDVRSLVVQAEMYCPMLIEIVRQELIRSAKPPGV